MTPEEVAWVAGLFEGEGCFRIIRRKAHYRPQIKAQLRMTDEDVIRRLHRLVGVGHVYKDTPSRLAVKQPWLWSLDADQDVRWFIGLILPWLGERRAARARELLEQPPIRRVARSLPS